MTRNSSSNVSQGEESEQRPQAIMSSSTLQDFEHVARWSVPKEGGCHTAGRLIISPQYMFRFT